MTYRDHMRAVAEKTAPTPQMEAEVRRRLAERRSPMAGWAPLGGLALAAAALVTVWMAWPEAQPVETSIAVEPVQIALSEGESRLGSVRVEADGTGIAEGADTDWQIAWSSGSLAVEVPPDGRHEVVVRTPEAEVTVVGTVFDVDRTALGTAVAVSRGTVAVDCVEGDSVELKASQEHLCLPATASGMLGRARALTDDAAILAAIDRGRELGAEPRIDAELSVARLDPLIRQGRSEEALAEAEAYLGSPEATRIEQVRHVAVALALQIGGCDRAYPHLAALEHPTPEEAQRLAVCEPH